MPRQYFVLYKRGTGPFSKLQPNVHSTLIDKPEVSQARDIIRENPHIEGIVVRLEDEMYNLIAFTQDAEAPNAFKLEEPLAPEFNQD